jgi:hypothetical protein
LKKDTDDKIVGATIGRSLCFMGSEFGCFG